MIELAVVVAFVLAYLHWRARRPTFKPSELGTVARYVRARNDDGTPSHERSPQ